MPRNKVTSKRIGKPPLIPINLLQVGQIGEANKYHWLRGDYHLVCLETGAEWRWDEFPRQQGSAQLVELQDSHEITILAKERG